MRLGGDEFVILLVGQDERADPAHVLSRVRAAIAEPVPIEGQMFRVTSSIGLARYPQDGQDAETLLLNADVAMYQAKEKGRDTFQFYTAEMNAAAHERRVLQEGLRHHRRQPVRAALPAADRSQDRRHLRGRGAGPLAPSRSSA